MEWPKVESSFTKSQWEYKFIGGSWLPVLMSVLMLSSFLLPYLIVLGRGSLNPFLPFISQVIGSPPQSGIFCLIIVLSSLLAFIGLNLFFMGIRLQCQRLKDDWVRHTASLLNKISLIPGSLGIVGMLMVGAFPMDFNRHTDVWMVVTIIPHLIGALSLFFGGMFYCLLITYVLNLLHPDRRQMLTIRVFLITLCTMCAALQGYTVRDAFFTEFEQVRTNCLIQAEDVPYNMSYLVSSVCEWCLIFSLIVFFMTLKDEARGFNFCMGLSLREEETEKPTVKKEEETVVEENKS